MFLRVAVQTERAGGCIWIWLRFLLDSCFDLVWSWDKESRSNLCQQHGNHQDVNRRKMRWMITHFPAASSHFPSSPRCTDGPSNSGAVTLVSIEPEEIFRLSSCFFRTSKNKQKKPNYEIISSRNLLEVTDSYCWMWPSTGQRANWLGMQMIMES